MSLVEDIRAGSAAAVKQLYQENAQEVYDFAKGITGNHDTAMQATKDTLAKLVQQIKAGNTPANIHSEALKLAYDEACKIAMPSVQNVKSPYDTEEEAPAVKESAPAKVKKEAPKKAATVRKYEETYDEYEEDDYVEETPRRRSARKSEPRYEARQQAPVRNSRRDDYYADEYDDYDDYDDYGRDDYYDDYEERKGHGAGFYICLIINIILVLLLIWFLIGLLINLGVLSESLSSTLGYEWFDNHIYQLF